MQVLRVQLRLPSQLTTTSVLDITPEYKTSFKGNNIDVLLGYHAELFQSRYNRTYRTDMANDVLTDINAGAASTAKADGYTRELAMLSWFGRIAYDYKGRYLFEANARYDGSSRFAGDNKWGFFPSFSAGWRFSDEAFWESMKGVVSNAKLRASWGSIGDQSVANSLYIPTMSRTEASWVAGDGTKLVYYGSPAAVSASLTWQDIVTLDFGLDATLFEDFGVTFDWFQRETKNMIVGSEGVGYNFGAAAPKGNFGSLRTRGWELALDWGHIWNNGLSLRVNASLADAKTIVTEYGNATGIYGWYNGKEYGEIWGYKTDGLFTKDDFAYDANGNLIVVPSTDPSNVSKDGKPYPYNHHQYASGKSYPLQDRISGGGTYTKFGPGDVRYRDLNGDGETNISDVTLLVNKILNK